MMSFDVSNKLRSCIVFYDLFSKFFWKTSLDQKSDSFRKKNDFLKEGKIFKG